MSAPVIAAELRAVIEPKIREHLAKKNAAAVAAVTVAVAAAAAEAALDNTYDAAYWAARNYYKEHPMPITQAVADLVASQKGAALDLLDRLIDAREEA